MTSIPHWAVEPSPESTIATVGLNADGEFYLYGDSPDQPGPVLQAIRGAVVGMTIIQLGGNSRFGLRDYLEVRMVSDAPTEEFRLLLAAKPSPNIRTGQLQLPWSVRSLLGCLIRLDLNATPVKLSPKRGAAALFIRVIPCSSDWSELPECRAIPIGPEVSDMASAVNAIRGSLALPALPPRGESLPQPALAGSQP